MGSSRIPGQAKDQQQTDSPTASRPGFRLACQFAANNKHDLYHIDLKTAFLQGEAYDECRDVICQLPAEAGYPPHIAARLKRPAYGLNDAPRRWWNIIDKAIRDAGGIPTRADRCCYVVHSKENRVSGHVDRTSNLNPSKTTKASSSPISMLEEAMDHLLDPVHGNVSKGKNVCGAICLHVDDLFLFMIGTPEFYERVIKFLHKQFTVGSEDKMTSSSLDSASDGFSRMRAGSFKWTKTSASMSFKR